jgi:BirA family transcriptional regulator, biotin operon repressor / biotin---[acetyl-CoA-carboxylase] ligase
MHPEIISTDSARQKIGTKLICFSSIGSTNTWLLEHPEYLEMDGLVVQADNQTTGKGRKQRVWSGGKQNHLFCSLVLHLSYKLENIGLITLLTGLSINKALRKLTSRPFAIKWPNDILINNQKICGILCETKFQAPNLKPIVVIGIGINVSGDSSQYPRNLKNKATTLEMVTNQQYDIIDIREKVLDEFELIYQISVSRGFETLINEWEQLSCSIGKKIYFDQAGSKKKGEILGLSQHGHLKVKIPGEDGIINILSGEIEYIDAFYNNEVI